MSYETDYSTLFCVHFYSIAPNYKIMGYASDGKEKEVEFMSHHNLKHEAYLEVLYNKKKGVMSWEERQRNEVPKEALKHLE